MIRIDWRRPKLNITHETNPRWTMKEKPFKIHMRQCGARWAAVQRFYPILIMQIDSLEFSATNKGLTVNYSILLNCQTNINTGINISRRIVGRTQNLKIIRRECLRKQTLSVVACWRSSGGAFDHRQAACILIVLIIHKYHVIQCIRWVFHVFG